MLVRSVDEAIQFCEIDDPVESTSDLALGHAVQTRGETDVLSNRQITDEAAGDLDEWSHAAAHFDNSLISEQDSGDKLEQRRFTLPVAAHDADRLPGPNIEGYVAQCPEFVGTGSPRGSTEEVLEASPSPSVAAEPNSEAADRDRKVSHHSSFRTGRSRRRKTNAPKAKKAKLITAASTTLSVSHTSGKKPMR